MVIGDGRASTADVRLTIRLQFSSTALKESQIFKSMIFMCLERTIPSSSRSMMVLPKC